jgi:signal transduction histidine kinase
VVDAAGPTAELWRATGALSADLPRSAALKPEGGRFSPLGSVAHSRSPEGVTDVALVGTVFPPPGEAASITALVLPILGTTRDVLVGLLVVGVSPHRTLDAAYRSFFDLVERHIATAIADARAYHRERQRAAALAELDRAKTTFFGNVSHEFRTPLTLILGQLEELKSVAVASFGADGKARLEAVNRNALRLLKLVNTLLDFSRIEAGRMQARYQPTDLTRVTTELVGVFRSAIEKAGLELIVRCDRLSGPVYVDRDMWEKVVLNLLSNALKFTFDGEIEVRLRDTGQGVELTVRDTGVGITPADQSRIFDRFHRVEGVRARTHEGSGIGLALVQELVQMHGGQLEVDSRLGVGTSFTIALRYGASHLPEHHVDSIGAEARDASRAEAFVTEAMRWLPTPGAQEPAITRPASRTRPAILVADDNADMRDYLVAILEEVGDVCGVGNGEEALRELRAQRFDLLLTDMMMPIVDGAALLAQVRTDRQLRDLPVIIVSARAGEESRIEALRAGADDYLVKPFSPREVVARVEANMNLARLRAAGGAERAHNDLLAVVSHELRTPMAAILLWSRLLISGALKGDEQRREALRSILVSAEAQNQLVEDLLDVSRLKTGKLRIEAQPVELSQVVRSAIDALRPVAQAKGVLLMTDGFGARLPEASVVRGDPNRLRQVVSNLVSNAIKFTPAGGSVLVVLENVGDKARLVVGDTGCGIEPERLEQIFGRFAHRDVLTTRMEGGMGLGLTIVRHLVELHDGQVSARSAGAGRGATFTVDLPMLHGFHLRGERRSGSREEIRRPLDGVRVLLVEDHGETRRALTATLAAAGADVVPAASSDDALRSAGESPPDVVVSDICMPGKDGYAFLRSLRDDAAAHGREIPPALALTAHAGETAARALAAGFKAHAAKPIRPEDLLRLVTELSGQARSSADRLH